MPLTAPHRKIRLLSGGCWLVALIVIITYLPLLPRLGLYQGDITFLWIGEHDGASSLIDALSDDRPGAGVQFALAHALFGANIAVWHLYALIMRIIGGWAALWGLRAIFPRVTTWTTAAAVLVSIYPGYLAQPMAVNLQNYLAAWMFSLIALAATWRAAGSRSAAGLHILSILSTFVYLFLLEGFIGIEILRLALLWLHPSTPRPLRARFGWVVRHYAPAFAAIVGFSIWRFFIYDDTLRPETNTRAIFQFLREAGSLELFGWRSIFSLFDALIGAWIVPLIQRLQWITAPMLIPAVAAGLLARRVMNKFEIDRRTARTLLLIGIASTAAALIPLIILWLFPSLDPFNSRLLLPASLSAALALIGGIALFPRRIHRMAAALFIGIAVLTGLSDEARYAANWEIQRSFWTQFRAQIPGLVEGTTVIAAFPSTSETTIYAPVHDEILFPLNWIYAGSASDLRYGGFVLNINLVTTRQTSDEPVSQSFRSKWLEYSADFSRILVVEFGTDGCLRVLDPESSVDDPMLAVMAQYSDPSLIRTDAVPPPRPSWLTEPESICASATR